MWVEGERLAIGQGGADDSRRVGAAFGGQMGADAGAAGSAVSSTCELASGVFDGRSDALEDSTGHESSSASELVTAALPPLTVAIQAGGESRRMGRSKATVPFGGRPLLCRIVELVDGVADEIVVTTNGLDDLGFLSQMAQAPKIRVVRDLLDVRGSMTGLYTALASATRDYVAVCACDMMDVSANLFQAELACAVQGGFDAVVPETSNGFEPFHAVYRRVACLESALRSMAAARESSSTRKGGASMKSVLLDPQLNVRRFTMDEVRAVADPGCFSNCNTPDELSRAESRIFGKAV